jgi:hypothetical protein
MQAGGELEALKTRLRTGSRNAAKLMARVTGVDRELRRLLDRVATLELEVQETRRLHQRLAELTDIVTEVLVPAADRDDDRINAILAKYNQTSF